MFINRSYGSSPFSATMIVRDYERVCTERWLTVFTLGFLVYTMSWAVTMTTYADYILFQTFQVAGILLFLPAAYKLIRWRFDSLYLQLMFTLYCLWTFFTISRGFQFGYSSVKKLLLDPYDGIFVYFAPLIILFPAHLRYLRRLFTVIVIMGVTFLVYDILFAKDLVYIGVNFTSQLIAEFFTKSLAIPCGFILLTYVYQPRKRVIFALLVMLVGFLFAAVRARRGLMFISFNIFFFWYLTYYAVNRLRFSVLVISLVLVGALYWGGTRLYNENKNGLLLYITERMNEGITATRNGVEVMFYKDMKPVDWVVGKGINGYYYCPGIERDTVHRTGIESDYLSIILKGGLVSLAILLLIMIPAMWKGFFASRNRLTKAAAFWILLYLLGLYPIPMTDFTLNHLLVWISVAICYSPTVREMPEEVVERLLK